MYADETFFSFELLWGSVCVTEGLLSSLKHSGLEIYAAKAKGKPGPVLIYDGQTADRGL